LSLKTYVFFLKFLIFFIDYFRGIYCHYYFRFGGKV
jgi:hypothetical protein